jgi:aldehyde dehydrogenase family protein
MKPGAIFVAGQWRAPGSGETYQPINPANEEPLAPVGRGDERDVDLAVTAARRAFEEPSSRRASGKARASWPAAAEQASATAEATSPGQAHGAMKLVLFILSNDGQRILARYRFSAPTRLGQ